MKRALKVLGLLFAAYCIGLGAFAVVSILLEPPSQAIRSTSQASSPPAPDRSKKVQAERKRLIEKLIRQGIFTKVDRPGTLMRVYTGPTWKILSFDQRQQFVSVVSAYAGNPTNHYLVPVHDGQTNHRIGTFTQSRGLLLD